MASRVALAATLAMGIYVWLRPAPPGLGRIYAFIAIPVTFILVYRITQHLATAWLSSQRKDPENADVSQ